eukprot:765281-Hanusia_phi.AAC.4
MARLDDRLRDPSWSVRLHAVRSLAAAPDVPESLAQALELLEDEDVGVRAAAVEAVGAMVTGSECSESVHQDVARRLLALTNDEEGQVRAIAAHVLQTMLTSLSTNATFMKALICSVKNRRDSARLKAALLDVFKQPGASPRALVDSCTSIFDQADVLDSSKILMAELLTSLSLWQNIHLNDSDLQVVCLRVECRYTRTQVLGALMANCDGGPFQLDVEYLKQLLEALKSFYDIPNLVRVLEWFVNHSFTCEFIQDFIMEFFKDGTSERVGEKHSREMIAACTRYFATYDKVALLLLIQNSPDLPEHIINVLKKLSAEMEDSVQVMRYQLESNDMFLRLHAMTRARKMYSRRGFPMIAKQVFRDCSPKDSSRSDCVLDVLRWSLRLQDDPVLLRSKFDLQEKEEIKLEDEEVWERMERSLDCNICIVDGFTLRSLRRKRHFSKTLFVAVLNGHAYGVEEDQAEALMSPTSESDEGLSGLYQALVQIIASEDPLHLFACSVLGDIAGQGHADLIAPILETCRRHEQDEERLGRAINLLLCVAPMNHAPTLQLLASCLVTSTDANLRHKILVGVGQLVDERCNLNLLRRLLSQLVGLRKRLALPGSHAWTLTKLIDAWKDSAEQLGKTNRLLVRTRFKLWSREIRSLQLLIGDEADNCNLEETQKRKATGESEYQGGSEQDVEDLYAQLLSKNFDVTDRSLNNYKLNAALEKKRRVLETILARLSPDDHRLMKIAVKELDHSDGQIRKIAVTVLEKVDAPYKIALLTKLVSMLRSNSLDIQRFAVAHLMRQDFQQFPFILHAMKEV